MNCGEKLIYHLIAFKLLSVSVPKLVLVVELYRPGSKRASKMSYLVLNPFILEKQHALFSLQIAQLSLVYKHFFSSLCLISIYFNAICTIKNMFL